MTDWEGGRQRRSPSPGRAGTQLTGKSRGQGRCAGGLAYLHALDLQFHVVLSGRFAIFPLFPAIPIFPVFHFLPVVEDHGAILGSGNNKWLSYQENQARKKFMKKDIIDQ